MNNITGTINIFGKEYSFIFEDNILKINIDAANKSVDPLSSGKLSTTSLTGIFDNNSRFITFFVGNNSYFTGLTAKYYAYTTFQIGVIFYIIHEVPLDKLKFSQVKIEFENEKFRKWLGFYEKHIFSKRKSKEGNLKEEVNYCVASCKNKTVINNLDTKVELYPSFSISYNYESSSFHTKLCFTYKSRVLDYEFINHLFISIHKTLKFIFYRQNIEFGKVYLFLKHQIGKCCCYTKNYQ